MTAFRLVDLEEPKVSEVLKQMERFQPAIGHAILNKTGVIQVGGNFKFDLTRRELYTFFLSQCYSIHCKDLHTCANITVVRKGVIRAIFI